IPAQTVDLRDGAQLARLGRSDDRAPRTLDLRASQDITDGIGRVHFDNHGIFLTFGRIVGGDRANAPNTAPSPTRFTFDRRLLVKGDQAGIALQLLDALDGTPLTRAKLDAEPAAFFGKARGFDLRIRGVSLADPAFTPVVTMVAANLADFTKPLDA